MKILVAEDNPVIQTMLRSMLKRWEFEAQIVRDGDEAWAVLHASDPPRMAILDWMMPGVDGVELCRRVRAIGREPYTYIILLTARTQAEDLVEGMDAGADDYLTKPFQSHELRVRLRAGRRIVELQEQLLQAREALREQATHDGLTGLWNRTAILDMLHRELARSNRCGGSLSVLMVDLDHFKRINDTYGHVAGDAVLRECAARMQGIVRSYDGVGRYGGEEFLCVLPGCDASAGNAQAERTCRAIAAAPVVFGEVEIPITCSIGMACSERPDEAQAKALVAEADSALYRAKRQRNCVEGTSLEALATVQMT